MNIKRLTQFHTHPEFSPSGRLIGVFKQNPNTPNTTSTRLYILQIYSYPNWELQSQGETSYIEMVWTSDMELFVQAYFVWYSVLWDTNTMSFNEVPNQRHHTQIHTVLINKHHNIPSKYSPQYIQAKEYIKEYINEIPLWHHYSFDTTLNYIVREDQEGFLIYCIATQTSSIVPFDNIYSIEFHKIDRIVAIKTINMNTRRLGRGLGLVLLFKY